MSDNQKKEKSKGKVLLVDDDPLIIRMYEYKLSRDGYQVLLAFDGEKAILTAKLEKPDIILLDLMMPRMNGVETLKFLRKESDTKDIPVIILTNLGDDKAYVDLTKDIGAEGYLVKADTSLKDLAKMVGDIIGSRKK